MSYRTYSVSARKRAPLLRFMIDALQGCGCRVLYASPPNRAPFRITFETPEGERMGIVAYAFLANTKVTKNRPGDEHRFQLKYGAKDGELHEIWQDPYGLYTTLLLGINPEEGFFVGADPVLHNPTKMFISIEFKQREVDEILSTGWAAWERDRRSDGDPVEVLVGGKPQSFLDYIRFEREARGEDQGHRQALAESPHERHDLASELGFSEQEVMNLIQSTPMTKMAVRGAAAEEHLARALGRVRGVSDCARGRKGEADVLLRFHGVPLSIECKNVLRRRNKDNLARVDFQRTRTSIADRCSRYYSPSDFSVVAACLHAVTERWEFRFAVPGALEPHENCPGKLDNNVSIDERWQADAYRVLEEAVG